MGVLWVVILIVTVSFFIVSHTVILPNIFLRARVRIKSPVGNGVKVMRDSDGRKILYKTDESIGKYVEGYIISEKEGKKEIVCKVNDEIGYIDYDVVSFNHSNKMIDTINVQERICDPGYTAAVRIPDSAAYALVYLNEADGEKFQNDRRTNVRTARFIFYLLCCLAVEISTVFIARLCWVRLCGGPFGEILSMSPASIAIACVICAAAFILNTIVTLFAIRGKREKKGK